MINRKNQTKKYKFWSHFHTMLDISKTGNEKISERLSFFSSVDDFTEKNYLLANIPEKYFDLDFSPIKDKLLKSNNTIEEIEKFEKYYNAIDKAAEKGIGLYIYGSHGVGKTSLAIILLKIAIQKYYSAFFSTSNEALEFMRAGWKNEDKKFFWTYVINNCKFFVIDDIGRLFSQFNEGEKTNINDSFIKRDNSNLCTIMTANHSLDQNRDLLGEALYSNFKERLIEIKFVGEDYRNIISKQLLDELNHD